MPIFYTITKQPGFLKRIWFKLRFWPLHRRRRQA